MAAGKILVVGSNEELTRQLETEYAGRQRTLTVVLEDWQTVKKRASALSKADIVLLDLTTPDAYTERGLTNLQKSHPFLPFLLRTDASFSHESALTRLLEKPGVDFVRSSADADEVKQRISRLLKSRQAEPGAEPTAKPKPISQKLVAELHDASSGRLDARRIAEFFGITLADVARSLGVSLSRLHKTPAAASAQSGLFVYERIAYALLLLAGSKGNARIWLNLPEAQLSDKPPVTLIREGRGAIVAEMLDDMLLGQPS